MGDNHPKTYELLTAREAEILSLIADGLSNQEIADQLFLTRDTVKWYNSQIFQKLHVKNRTQAVSLARELGLLSGNIFASQFQLPQQQTPFVGRERELVDLQTMLRNPKCRLLTLLGSGGMGKTRLALEVAQQSLPASPNAFSDGAVFVPLQDLNSPDDIISGIAEAVHFRLLSGGDPAQQLLRYLRDKAYLMILDNFEHLLEGADNLSEILAAAPKIKVLATSREALNLQEEWLYALNGMPYPASAEKLESYGAIQLFAYHAQRIRSDFSVTHEAEGIVRICKLVEGLPLALELAASWVRVLPCSEIAREIEIGLDILETPTRNVLPRHSSIRAVLEHSWLLLTDDERAVFARMSVFRGGFTREAAMGAASASLRLLSDLVDKSWLRWNAALKRYDIHELLRQYGLERLQLDTQMWQDANEMHCRFYADFLAARRLELKVAREKAAYDEIEIELENVRASWDWAIEHQQEAEISAAFESLWRFYDMGSRFQEGQNAFAHATDMLRSNIENADTRLLLGKVLARQGALTFSLDRFSEGETLLRESRAILSEFDAPGDLAFCLHRLSMTLGDITNLEWKTLIEESIALFRQIGDLSGVGEGLTTLGTVYEYQIKDLDKAIELTQAGLAACSEAGDHCGVATAYSTLASMLRKQRNYPKALDYAQKCLFIFQQLGFIWGVIIAYRDCGWALCGLGLLSEARRYAYHALAVSEKYGLMRYTLHTLLLIATILIEAGEAEHALELCALVDETSRKLGSYPYTDVLFLRLEQELPPGIYSEVAHRGRLLNFEDTVKGVLSGWNSGIDPE